MLYYIGTYYSDLIIDRKPMGSRAENYKMEYIISALKRAGFALNVVSAIGYQKNGFFRKKEFKIDSKERHTYLGNYSSQKRLFSKIGVLSRLIVLFLYLLLNVKKSDKVIVYNTPIFSLPVRLAQGLKRFELILQIEELFYYEKSNKRSVKFEQAEKKLIKAADKYIVANDIIYKKVCNKNHPGVIVYGPYFVPKRKNERFSDGFYHIVYGGGFDYLRRVDLAVEAMNYLDSKYHFDVFAFGDAKSMKELKVLVDKTNSNFEHKKITLHPPLSGEEYTSFLQKCHIGLNLQEAGSDFDEMAFPSKISTYLGCGLSVVSSSLTSIRSSSLKDVITYYEANDAVSIAEAIKKCSIKNYTENTSVLSKLDKRFVDSIKDLIDGGAR